MIFEAIFLSLWQTFWRSLFTVSFFFPPHFSPVTEDATVKTKCLLTTELQKKESLKLCKNSNLLTYLRGILPKDLLGINSCGTGVRQPAGLPGSRKRLLHLSQSNWNCSLNQGVKPHAHLIFSLGRSQMSHWSQCRTEEKKTVVFCSCWVNCSLP